MKVVISESWTEVMEALIVHKEVTTNTEEYTDANEIVQVLNWWFKDSQYEHLHHLRITAEKDFNRSSHRNPWYIIRLVPTTNKNAANLLESEY